MRKGYYVHRRLCFLWILTMFLLLCACGKKEEKTDVVRNTAVQRYEMSGLKEFCVDEEYLYCILNEDDSVYQYALDGAFIKSYEINADDELADVYTFLGERPANADDLSGLCMSGTKLYCYRSIKGVVIELDLVTGQQRICGSLPTAITVSKATAGENTLLYHAILSEPQGKAVAILMQTESGETSYLSVEEPVSVVNCGGDSYWMEGLLNGEIYFQKYDANTDSYSEQYIAHLEYQLWDIGYCEATQKVIGYSLSECISLLPEEPQVAARFCPDIQFTGSTLHLPQFVGERMYIQNDGAGIIYSFLPEEFTQENKPLKGYVLDLSDVPDWSGYQIDLEELTWEEMALKALAGDSDYDFLVLSTDMEQAAAIRDAYCYYPIPKGRISEYWENCFPYLRDAATYEGDIWMLPLRCYTEGIVYREDNLAKYGLSMEDVTSYADISEMAEILYDSGETGKYSVTYPTERLLQEYLRLAQESGESKRIEFDTEEFHAILDYMKSDLGMSAEYRNSWIQIDFADYTYLEEEHPELDAYELDRIRWEAFLSNIFFEEVSANVIWEYDKYIGLDGAHVMGIPTFSGEDMPSMVSADILIINPNSRNLDAVLDFAETMAKRYITDPACYISSVSSIYPQDTFSQELYQVYSDGEIVFKLPDELFSEYYEYCNGTYDDREQMLEEVERTVDIYLHE